MTPFVAFLQSLLETGEVVLGARPQPGPPQRGPARADTLAATWAAALRQWPLSGVLSEVEDGPLTSVEFHGPPGLQLLYAERLARHEKPAWVAQGRGFELVELVLAERGRERSP